MNLSVVLPVYNEKQTVLKVIERVLEIDFVHEIIVVDDGSSDGTGDFLKKAPPHPKVKMFFHEKNKGKGAALRTGFKEVSGEVTIIQDADMEYDPSEYVNLIKPIEKGEADVVYGSRLTGGRPQRAYMFWHKLGNSFITLVCDILYNTTLTDIETGYKMIRTRLLKEIIIRSNGFEFEPEITAKILKKRMRVYELPISYYGRTYAEGKKIHWYDGFGALWTLIKYRFIN